MNPILDRLVEQPTGIMRPSEWLSVSCDDNPTGEIKPHTLDRDTEYELTMKVSVHYWANGVQHSHARCEAERYLMSTIYSDGIALLAALRYQIECGTQKEAWRICCHLDALFHGEKQP